MHPDIERLLPLLQKGDTLAFNALQRDFSRRNSIGDAEERALRTRLLRSRAPVARVMGALLSPSPMSWRWLCSSLDHLAPTSSFWEWMDQQLAGWPDGLRVLPDRWLTESRQWASLCRSLHQNPFAPSIPTRIAHGLRHGHLKTITSIRGLPWDVPVIEALTHAPPPRLRVLEFSPVNRLRPRDGSYVRVLLGTPAARKLVSLIFATQRGRNPVPGLWELLCQFQSDQLQELSFKIAAQQSITAFGSDASERLPALQRLRLGFTHGRLSPSHLLEDLAQLPLWHQLTHVGVQADDSMVYSEVLNVLSETELSHLIALSLPGKRPRSGEPGWEQFRAIPWPLLAGFHHAALLNSELLQAVLDERGATQETLARELLRSSHNHWKALGCWLLQDLGQTLSKADIEPLLTHPELSVRKAAARLIPRLEDLSPTELAQHVGRSLEWGQLQPLERVGYFNNLATNDGLVVHQVTYAIAQQLPVKNHLSAILAHVQKELAHNGLWGVPDLLIPAFVLWSAELLRDHLQTLLKNVPTAPGEPLEVEGALIEAVERLLRDAMFWALGEKNAPHWKKAGKSSRLPVLHRNLAGLIRILPEPTRGSIIDHLLERGPSLGTESEVLGVIRIVGELMDVHDDARSFVRRMASSGNGRNVRRQANNVLKQARNEVDHRTTL